MDNPELQEDDNGKNGKRRVWNFQSVVPNTDKGIVITIHDKSVFNTSEFKCMPISIDKCVSKEEFKINATDALEASIKKYKLNPRKNWAIGYHFILFKAQNLAELDVMGLDSKGYITKILHDATKKQRLKQSIRYLMVVAYLKMGPLFL